MSIPNILLSLMFPLTKNIFLLVQNDLKLQNRFLDTKCIHYFQCVDILLKKGADPNATAVHAVAGSMAGRVEEQTFRICE